MAEVESAGHDPAEGRRWLGLGVLLTAKFVAVMDLFVVNVALPTLQRDLAASPAEMQLVLAVYSLSFGLALIPGGRLGDRYGRRPLFVVGIVGFTAASAVAAAASGAEVLIGARLVQGVCAGLMLPQTLSFIQANFHGRDRIRALGLLAMTAGVASSLAQALGGGLLWLDPWGLGWRAIFLVNVPVGLGALAAAAVALRERPSAGTGPRPRLDVGGALIGTLALGLLAGPLVLGQEVGWSAATLGLLAAAVPALVAFVRYERRVARRADVLPIVDLTLFADRGYALGLGLQLLYAAVNAAHYLMLPLFLQGALGASALANAAVFGPLTLCYAVVSLAGAPLAVRLGGRSVALGAGGSVVGLALFGAAVGTLGTATPLWLIALSNAVVGAAHGLITAPLQGAILRRVPACRVGSASGLLATAIEIGFGFGTILGGMLYAAALPGADGAVGAALTVTAVVLAGSAAIGLAAVALPAGIHGEADRRNVSHNAARCVDRGVPAC